MSNIASYLRSRTVLTRRARFSKVHKLFSDSHIFNTHRGSLHTRGFRRTHLSVFRYRLTKNGSASPKSFRSFRETGPVLISVDRNVMLFLNKNTILDKSLDMLTHFSVFLRGIYQFAPSPQFMIRSSLLVSNMSRGEGGSYSSDAISYCFQNSLSFSRPLIQAYQGLLSWIAGL